MEPCSRAVRRVGVARLVTTGLALLALGALAPPAAAGGVTMLDVEGGYAASGRRALVRVEALFPDAAQARRVVAGRGLAVWLEPGKPDWRRVDDWRGPRPGAERATLEDVEGSRDGNLARLRLRVRLPELAPGAYTAVLCDPGCDRLLGGVWPTPVTVAASPAEARLQRRLDRWQARAERRLGAREGRFARRLDGLQAASLSIDSSLRLDVEALRDDTAALRQRLDAITAVLAREDAAAQGRAAGRRWVAVLVAVVALAAAGGAAGWWVLRHGRRGALSRTTARPPPSEVDRARTWERA